MIFQILKKLFLVFLCLSLLSSLVFADDLIILEGEQFNTFGNLTAADYGLNSVSYAVSITYGHSLTGSKYTYVNAALSDSNPSVPFAVSDPPFYWKLSRATVAIPAGTLTVSYPFTLTGSRVSTSSAGASVTYDESGFTVVSDGSTSPIILDMSGSKKRLNAPTGPWSSSFTPADPVDPGPEPEDPYAGTGSMFGWTGSTLFTLRFVDGQHWYTLGSGSDRVGHLDVVVATTEAEMPGYYARTSMLAALTFQKWKWSIDKQTGLPKFDVMQEQQGTWADMLYRTSVYNYFWGNKLWNNDVSGSWYGSISSDFSYLNYRVNQILDVLANDEDLSIKNATSSERNWVKDYFSGSGDKADSVKYDKLHNTGSAFKDAFAGAPDSSIADGFTAVNDNSYEFWSQRVSDDINGNSSSSSYSSRSSAYVPPEQRIVDAYSENWAQIVGGYYD